MELQAAEKHNFRKAFYWNDGFYKKYSWVEKVQGFGRWVGSKFSLIIWGHGESPLRVMILAVSIILGFAILYRYKFPGDFSGMDCPITFFDYIRISLCAFTSAEAGNILPVTTIARWVSSIESTIGLVIFGFFVGALYRRISKR